MRFLACTIFVALLGCASAPAVVHTSEPRDEATLHFERASFFAQRGDSVRAEQYFVAAMREGYPEERVLSPLLRTCLNASRLRAARSYAEGYVLRHPETHTVRTLLASLHLALGDTDAARAELANVLALAPTHATAHYLLGVIARDFALDACEARASFKEYLALAPTARHAAEARRFLASEPCPTVDPARFAAPGPISMTSAAPKDASAPTPLSTP